MHSHADPDLEDRLVLVQISFRSLLSEADYAAHCSAIARAFTQVEGLCWKLWWRDEANLRAGGIYLFRDAACARGYLAGPLVNRLRASPDAADVVIHVTQVLLAPSAITGGGALPVSLAASG